MSEIPDGASFALVSYIPDPLASFIYQMRRSLSEGPCPQPHVTLLPPRPLRIPAEAACRTAQNILQSYRSFEVELSRIRPFVNTNTLYLDIADGAPQLHALHDSLNSGDLFHPEEFAFRPHLTVAGLVDPRQLPALLQQAEASWRAHFCSPRFMLSEIVCLLQETDTDNWRRLWSIKLLPALSTVTNGSPAVPVIAQNS